MNSVADVTETWIHENWQVYQSQPGEIEQPSAELFATRQTIDVTVPGSLYQSVSDPGHALTHLDDFDWWYRCNFDTDSELPGKLLLELNQLAGLAEVWLNDVKIAESSNYFLPLGNDISDIIREDNRLVICFRSLTQFLKQRRPRPRWKTNLVDQQQLRWLRLSLLGRIPGWTPATPALGLCGEIKLTRSVADFSIEDTRLTTRLQSGKGLVEASVTLSQAVKAVKLQFGDEEVYLDKQDDNDKPSVHYRKELIIDRPKLWWPNTHGEANLYDCQLVIESEHAEQVVDLEKRGFRSVELDTDQQRWQLNINDKAVFARGACWTIADINSFTATESELRRLLTRARDANMNMLRVGGTMTYESDVFYRLCDELGIMVWQDFMFANMDYPFDDAGFHDNVVSEVTYQLKRLSRFACISVYCGSSEIQQQAAMVGMPEEHWSNVFFDQTLPGLCADIHPGLPYVPSTPFGGTLPFHISEGVCHFYGVGAYKKTVPSSGLDKVKFTAECLGFSNVPEPATVEQIFNGNMPACHTPEWKRGVPRDSSAGWDFEDIRDHYLEQLFSVNAVQLRSRDTLRYLALSRIVTGELMKQVVAHWRNADCDCAGALIWFYKDIVAGAGWGLLDSDGDEKAAYFAVKQAFNPFAVFLIDDGLDGLRVNIINETATSKNVRLEIKLLAVPNIVTASYSNQLDLKAESSWGANVEGLLGHFTDINYNYQFGPMQHRIVSVQVFDTENDNLMAEDFYFPENMYLEPVQQLDLSASVENLGGALYLVLESDIFLQFVHLDLGMVRAETNYFHLLPGVSRKIRLEAAADEKLIKGYLTALNLQTPVRIRIKTENLENEQ